MLENWKTSTHHAWRPKITWGADASSRQHQLETHDEDSMEVMQSPKKGKAKKSSARARRVVRKEKSTQAKVSEKRQQNDRDSRVSVETVDSMDKASDCWYKQTNTSQGKGKISGKSKSKVAEISESDRSKQVDDWFPFQTRPHSSQIYLKWTLLDAQMRDSGYFRWKTARKVVTRWIGTWPTRLRSGKLRSTSWWWNSSLQKRWWWPERVRVMTWTTTLETRELRLETVQ